VRSNVGTGDKGITSLLSGERVPKTHARVEACGDLDELSSVLGALSSALGMMPGAAGAADEARREISWIQAELLNLGAWVACSPGSAALSALRAPSADATGKLESFIGRIEADLPPLQGFLLPGGSASASWAHVARSVCRRAERSAAAAPSAEALPFLNRLSTYLYALARWCNHRQGIAETIWKP
jgi:cob(I)alamin adenosyltransferase